MTGLGDDMLPGFDFEPYLKGIPSELAYQANTEFVSIGDRNNSPEVCKYYQKGSCSKARSCPYRHSRGDKAVVCKVSARECA